MLLSLGLPTALLMLCAFVVPRLLERFVPETLRGLITLGALSALILWALSALGFAALYLMQAPGIANTFGTRPASSLGHFATLGLKAALIWAPVLLLAISTAPKRWKTNRW